MHHSRRPPPRKPTKPEASPESRLVAVARAADALRSGQAVRLKDRVEFTMFAVETVSDKALARLRSAHLVLSHARARTLKIRLYTPDVIALPLRAGKDGARLRAIADPTADLDTPLKGPFEPVRRKLEAAYGASVKLAKLAGLLPAAVVCRGAARGAVEVAVSDIFAYEANAAASLTLVTRARVPLEGAEHSELVAFRAGDGAPENYAIIIDRPPTTRPVLTRVHSECFTGDLLGSLKCDCGAQLRGAIETISKAGGGVLLYLAQEGRGIGLLNKLRAYRLQDQGFDTLEANERLGFEADERLYATAAKMLILLGYKSVRLLTNNPDKIASLEAEGIRVAERVPHAFPGNEHNRSYLKTKAEKAGHLL
jgi:GTP cyclohydrolase II